MSHHLCIILFIKLICKYSKIYARPRAYGVANNPKSRHHKKRLCCVLEDGSIVPTSEHHYEKWKEVSRLMACSICLPRYPPSTKVSNRFRTLPDANPPPVPPPPRPGAFAVHVPPVQGSQINHLMPRDGGSSNNLRDDGIAGIRADGQRPAHNVHPASLARIRQQENASRAGGPWQNRIGGGIPHLNLPAEPYFNNHLHMRKTD